LEGGLPELVSEESERLGVMVMHEALKRPIRAVIENKTGETCGHILEKIEKEGNFFAGYDVKNCNKTFTIYFILERVCDMVESGVVDSYSVVKSIL
jgi:chaperonin GroEL (HSP60 family)